MIADGAMSMSFDPSAFLREFGLSATIIVFTGWVIVSACKSIFPPIGAAIGRWIDAKTEEVQANTKVIREIPNVITQTSKENREALIVIEKAMMGSESRIREDIRASKDEIKDEIKEEIKDERQSKIEKNLDKIVRKALNPKDPDTDPAPPKK